jgi:hypothetical protein
MRAWGLYFLKEKEESKIEINFQGELPKQTLQQADNRAERLRMQ